MFVKVVFRAEILPMLGKSKNVNKYYFRSLLEVLCISMSKRSSVIILVSHIHRPEKTSTFQGNTFTHR